MRKFKCRECGHIVEEDKAPWMCPECDQSLEGFVDLEFKLSNLKLEEFYSKPEEVTELELTEDEVGKLTEDTIKKFPNLNFVDIWTNSEPEFPKALLNANIEKMATYDFEPKQLKELNLKYLQIWWSDDLVSEVVKYFPQLESLLIEADEDIYIDEKIFELKDLKFLQIATRGGKVNYKVEDLSKLSKLESLRIVNTSLIDDFVYFSKCKNLKDIEVKNCESFKGFPKEIENLQELEELKLLQNENMSIENIKGLKNLKKLTIDVYNDDNFDFIKDLSNLEELEVNSFYKTHDENWNRIKINIPSLKNMTSLKKLILNGFKNLENLDFLSGLDLESIKLKSSNLNTDEKLNGFTSLYTMKNLKDLDLTCSSFNTVKNKKQLLKELLKMDSLENLESFVSQSVSTKALEHSSRKDMEKYLEKLEQSENYLENFKTFSKREDLTIEIVENELGKILAVDILFADERLQIEKSLIGIEVLDNFLERFLSEVSDETLIHLLKATATSSRGEYSEGIEMQHVKLHNLRASYRLSKIIIEESIKRKSTGIQKYCCDYYLSLLSTYDERDVIVKEYLEKEYFAQFEIEALNYFYEKALKNDIFIESLELFVDFIKKTEDKELVIRTYHANSYSYIWEEFDDIEDLEELEIKIKELDFPKYIYDEIMIDYTLRKVVESEDISELEQVFRSKKIDNVIWEVIDNRHLDIIDMAKELDLEKIFSIFVEKVKEANQVDINKLYVFNVFNKIFLEINLEQAAQFISEKINKDDITVIKQIIDYEKINKYEKYKEFVCTLENICLGRDIEKIKEELNSISKLNVHTGDLSKKNFKEEENIVNEYISRCRKAIEFGANYSNYFYKSVFFADGISLTPVSWDSLYQYSETEKGEIGGDRCKELNNREKSLSKIMFDFIMNEVVPKVKLTEKMKENLLYKAGLLIEFHGVDAMERVIKEVYNNEVDLSKFNGSLSKYTMKYLLIYYAIKQDKSAMIDAIKRCKELGYSWITGYFQVEANSHLKKYDLDIEVGQALGFLVL